MKKICESKPQKTKPVPVKNEQKITHFFNKLVLKKSESTSQSVLPEVENHDLSANIKQNQEICMKVEKTTDSSIFKSVYSENEAILSDITCASTNILKKRKVNDICNSENDIMKSPPNKKNRSNNLDMESNERNNLLKITTDFVVSPSKRSPYRGNKISPSKSNANTKCNLLENDSSSSLFSEECVSIISEKTGIEYNSENLVPSSGYNSSMNLFEEDSFYFDEEWETEINIIQDNIENLNIETWHFCNIKEVIQNPNLNLIIKLQSVKNKKITSCLLQGAWQYMQLNAGDYINIQAHKTTSHIPYVVDNNQGYVIFEPNFMVSPTTIVGSQFCMRRKILGDRFPHLESDNRFMIIGTLVHDLFESILQQKLFNESLIAKKIDEIVSSKETIIMSYTSQLPIEEIKNELISYIPKIVNFVHKYMLKNKKSENLKNKKNYLGNWKGSIECVKDIEETIWCPTLGMKGKIDITVKTDTAALSNHILPLELKTGRASMSLEHQGQVIMYIMMMNELGYNVSSGLLLYLREETLNQISASYREKRDLIMMRNNLVYFMKQLPQIITEENKLKYIIPELPEPINHHSACQKCPYSTLCTLFLSRDRRYELPDNHPLKSLSIEVLKHLLPSHIDYFIHWTSLIMLENNYQNLSKEMKDLWCTLPHKREVKGKALCNMKLLNNSIINDNNSYVHSFMRASDKDTIELIEDKKLSEDFLSSGLIPGNYIIISTNIRVAVATGFVKDISETKISVTLDRNLSDRYSDKIFHLDTYESQQACNFNMLNMASLMESNDRAKRLRELIIDKVPPAVNEKLEKSFLTNAARQILRKLNIVQRKAVLRILSAKEYMLIKGMPGTGKTATIVALIKLLVLMKKTVLITSHTHSAVDNICLQLLNDDGIHLLRLGSGRRINPNLQHCSETALTAHCKTPDEIKQLYNKMNVVAVTCLGAAHPFLVHHTLDYCLIDESTQVLQCTVLQALQSSKTFVLIGDPDQLPPVIRNPKAVSYGMSESLFDRLDNSNTTYALTLQYRMNKTITQLANKLTYNGQLQCADTELENATLQLPSPNNLNDLIENDKWLSKVLDTNIENAVVAIDTGSTWNLNHKDTDNLLLEEVQVASQSTWEDEGRKCNNYYEAFIIYKIVNALKQADVSTNSIGIIAPYRSQVSLLRKILSSDNENTNKEHIEINTVDQYQGRDKDIIIYSCTSSRNNNISRIITGFEILEDKRRLTVAITRAKYKLIIIGDFRTLTEYSPFNSLLNSLEANQKMEIKDCIENTQLKDFIKRVT